MNKLDSLPPVRAYTIPPDALDPGPARRLIVLAPDPEADIANAAPRLWELANALGCSIQLLGLCGDEAQEPSLRRQMITLSAMLAPITVEAHIEIGRDWLELVRHNWRPCDVIACFAGQPSGLGHLPLSQLLATGVDATVHVLDGLYPDAVPQPSPFSTVMFWAGALGVLAAFFWLQIRLVNPSGDWAHTALFYVSILAEVGLLWDWNTLFG
jgi:hypothetical protein